MRKIVSRITAWSFSRWDVHTRCPYQFKLKFLEKREETQHSAAARGEMLHKKSEDYVERRVKKLAPELIDERVRFLLGGFCADRRFNPALADRRNSSIDFEQALHLIPTDERKWHRLLTEADLLVTQYRRAIQNVALELLEHEVLNPMQLASIIRKSR
jgi:hypothetical protein